jgi:hypothetical protein
MVERDLDGIENVYRPPAADGDSDVGASVGALPDLIYVVSPLKLSVLYVATLGTYSVYWFYKQWMHQRLVMRRNLSPVGRAIFSIFFVAQLFKAIDIEARSEGMTPTWNPANNAGAFIVLTVIGRVLARLGGTSQTFGPFDLIAVLLPVLGVIPLKNAQDVVNRTAGDETGSRNARFGAGNIVIMMVGVVFWLLIGVGFLFSR